MLYTPQTRARLEQTLNRLAGYEEKTEDRRRERLDAARQGKRLRPYFYVLGRNAVLSDDGDRLQIPADAHSSFRGVYTSAMTDLTHATVTMNIEQTTHGPGGELVRRTLANRALSPYLFMGDMNVGSRRRGVANWVNLPEPFEITPDGNLFDLLIGRTAGAATLNARHTRTVFHGTNCYAETSDKGNLTSGEEKSIKEQITTTQQEAKIYVAGVDYSDSSYLAVEFANLKEWSLLLGFQTALEWSTVEVIHDPYNHKWSNAPIPTTAIAQPIGEAYNPAFARSANKFQDYVLLDSQYRMLNFPYLIPPRKPLILKFARRTSTADIDDIVGFEVYPLAMGPDVDATRNGLSALMLTV